MLFTRHKKSMPLLKVLLKQLICGIILCVRIKDCSPKGKDCLMAMSSDKNAHFLFYFFFLGGPSVRWLKYISLSVSTQQHNGLHLCRCSELDKTHFSPKGSVMAWLKISSASPHSDSSHLLQVIHWLGTTTSYNPTSIDPDHHFEWLESGSGPTELYQEILTLKLLYWLFFFFFFLKKSWNTCWGISFKSFKR